MTLTPLALRPCSWIPAADLSAAGLVVSRSMFSDHLPDNLLAALEQVGRRGTRRRHNGGVCVTRRASACT